MKKQFIIFTLILNSFFINMYAQLYQDWKWLHQSPQGNDLRWVKMWDVNTIYAIGNKGTFIKTTDRGATWIVQHKAGRIAGIPVQASDLRDAYFFDQNTGIVTGTYGSIFRTTNGGITFDSTNNPTPANTTVTSVSFINNLTGYAISGLTNYRLLKSTDGGMNWFSAPGSPPYSNPYHVRAFTENKIMVFNQLGDVCITTNGGIIWNTYPIGSQVNFYKSYFTDANTGYACGDWGRCRYTTDGGFTWTNMSGVLFDRNIHFFDIKVRGNVVYMTGNSNFVWCSTNLGTTWDSLEFISPFVLLPWINYFYGIDFLATSDTMVAVGSRGSVHQVLSSARTPLSQYLKAGSLRDIWASQSSGLIIAAGSPSSATASLTTHDQIMRSTNNGANWTVIIPAPNSTADFYSLDMIDENTGYVCGTKSAVYKTTNGGASWDSLVIPNMPAGLTLSDVDFVNAQTGWIFSRYLTGYDSTIYKTTNGGANWFKQKLNTSVSSENSVFSACMVDENKGWLLNSKPRPWKTTNGGTNWDSTKLGDNYLAGSLYDIKMLDAMTGYCCGSNNKVYKTTNGGATPWTNTGYSSTTVITNYTCEVRSPLECVVMGTYGTVYYTTNGGVSWTRNNPGGSVSDIYGSYLTPDGKLYAVTLLESNIHKNSVMFSVGINEPGISLPDKYELMQNYPNPFNPSTVIRFTLPKAGYVTLKLYDVSGREVMSVISNQFVNPGVNEKLLDGSNLPSGIYFCSLTVDNKLTGTRKMILLR
jgi:photosystem II stability/assembly factor-like uncharacterized protein